uniref:Battenin n=1 Tax=Oncorhynchus mykiss TaxID=8022 RepID=A0A8C7VP45_ONCMY
MLSAAHDILKQQGSHNSTSPNPSTVALDVEGGKRSRYDCSPVSTAAVLLADILPTLMIKFSFPFFVHNLPYGFRVLVCVATAIASFLVVSFSSTMWISVLGVIFASVSAGLGELSFLSLTVFFSRDVLGGWGSGTGGAGVAGALLYSGLTQAGLSPRNTLLIMLVVPVAMASVAPWQFIVSLQLVDILTSLPFSLYSMDDPQTSCYSRTNFLIFQLSLQLELLYFPNFYLSHAEQYRWSVPFRIYTVEVGSLHCVNAVLLCLPQCVNGVLLLLSVYYQFLPSAWLVFVIVLYEGLLGRSAYVNTFYFISKETGDRQREFAMVAASVGDSLGIAISGLIAFPVHRYFCSL